MLRKFNRVLIHRQSQFVRNSKVSQLDERINARHVSEDIVENIAVRFDWYIGNPREWFHAERISDSGILKFIASRESGSGNSIKFSPSKF